MRQKNRKAASSVSRRGFLQTSAAASAALMATLGTNYAHAQGSATVRVGLVGCGGRGRGAVANVLAAAQGVKLTALADIFADALELTKKDYLKREADEKKGLYEIKDDRCFSGWDAYQKLLASSDVDYVILATPPAFRPMMVKAAVEAGKHVFAEKPICIDPAGARMVIEAAAVAAQKNIGIVAGTQRRHQPSYIETIKRIHDGAIGRVVSAQVYWTQGGGKPIEARQPGWSDMEYQLRNWPYYNWLSGDHIVEQHMHQMDVMNWIMGGPPKLCIGSGGRQVRTQPEYGDVYDHFSIDYEYPDGTRVLSVCRQIDNTYARVGENIIGTKGKAFAAGKIDPFEGEGWSFDGEQGNPYELEHRDLIASIRAGKPLNEGKQCAESSLTAAMGRMSAYTGKLVTWRQVVASKLDLMPKELGFGPAPAVKVPVPGKDPLI